MYAAILEQNGAAVTDLLAGFEEVLRELALAMAGGDQAALRAGFEAARLAREEWRSPTS
jgi:prephenate dehydrogenase